jgi:hypothetical protein
MRGISGEGQRDGSSSVMRIVTNVCTTSGIVYIDIAKTITCGNLGAIGTYCTARNLSIGSMFFKEVHFFKRSGIVDMDLALFISNPELVRYLGPGHAGSIIRALPFLGFGQICGV